MTAAATSGSSTGLPREDRLFDELFAAASEGERGPVSGAEVYERRGSVLSLSEDEDGLRVEESIERGFAVRLFHSGRVGFAASGPSEAPGLVRRARGLLPRSRARRGARPASPLAGEPQGLSPLPPPPGPDEARADDLRTAFRRALAEAGHGTVVVREMTVTVGQRRERIATTSGRAASWGTGAASLVATVVGRGPTGRFSARVLATASAPERIPIARLARLAADRVLLPTQGRQAPSGRFDLLVDPHVAAHLLGRLASLFFGDSEEALLDARTRGGRDPFAATVLTLADAPGAPGGPVDTARDGEGTPQGRTVLVADGRLAARLTDVAAAARAGVPPSGNAVRRSWTEPPAIGVTNFHVDPAGGVSPLDLLGRVSRGVYAAVLLERPDVDLQADRFRAVTAGWAVERGRASAKLSGIVLEGRLSEFLRSISALGDDLKFVAGAGGGVGSPTLLVPRWKLP